MSAPTIVVVFLTYARTAYACRTIEAMRRHWQYPATRWYLADDGSDDAHVQAVLREMEGLDFVGMHSERRGYGYGATKAWHVAHDYADLTLFLEDDWELVRDFDPSPYVRALLAHDDLGMIRLAHLPINLKTESCGYDGSIYLRMLPGQQYAFSGNPALRHRRAREAWGPYPQNLGPGDTELAYDHQIQQRGGASIVWPVALGEWGVFGHIGAIQSYETKKGGG